MVNNLMDKFIAEINASVQDAARDLSFGASIFNIQAKVTQSKKHADMLTITTVVKLDSSGLKLGFNGSQGKFLPKGGYTVKVAMPYRYSIESNDTIIDVVQEELKRLKAELTGAFLAVAFNPLRSAEKRPPIGTTISRKMLVQFKSQYASEHLGVNGEVLSQFTVKHIFGEAGMVKLCIAENRLKKIGGTPNITFNDLRFNGSIVLKNQLEREIEIDTADGYLLDQTVRFSDKGLPQQINFKAAEKVADAKRTGRITKLLDQKAGGKFSFGAIGLSADYRKKIQTIYEAKHTTATRQEADDNLATWIQAVESSAFNDRSSFIKRLRKADGIGGATLKATMCNEDAYGLGVQLGKTYGMGHVSLKLAAQFGRKAQYCNTITSSLEFSKDGKSAVLTLDILNSKVFTDTLVKFVAGMVVNASLKSKIHEYSDDIVAQIECSFGAGSWLENLDLKKKVGTALYDIIKENVNKVALTFNVTREQGKWGRHTFKVSGIQQGESYDMLTAKMMAGDFSGAVAMGLRLSATVKDRERFETEVNFDFAKLLTYAMSRSREVADENKTWEYNGNKFEVKEVTGDVVKNVKSLNKTNFRVQTYYVTSMGNGGQPVANMPTQAITTVVYTSKENQVAKEREAEKLVGVANALNFDIYEPFAPKRATGIGAWLWRFIVGAEPLGEGHIKIATATSIEGHIQVLKTPPDQAQKLGEDVAKAVLGLGDSPGPQLAAQTFNLDNLSEPKRLEIASFINKYFWAFCLETMHAPVFDYRIDLPEIKKIRGKIQKCLENPDRLPRYSDNMPDAEDRKSEVVRIKTILPNGQMADLPDEFIVTAGATAILEQALKEAEDAHDEEDQGDGVSASKIYKATYNREAKDEKFITAMGQWARAIAENSKVSSMRIRLESGEKPDDQEVYDLVSAFMEMAAKDVQGSTAFFGDSKDLQSLVHWTILHAMAGEQNVMGLVHVQAENGNFYAASTPDLTPVKIQEKLVNLQKEIGKEKARLDDQTHG